MITFNRSSRKLLALLTYGYLLFPVILFFLNWTKWYISLPLIGLMLCAIRFALKESQDTNPADITVSKTCTIGTLILVLGWCWLSGVGGFSHQGFDFHFRNAVFRDLVEHPWPVLYHTNGNNTLLVYYFAYWLPAALAGKIIDFQCGLVVLYLWTVIGVLLLICQVSLYLNRASIIIPFVLMFFSSSCDIIPILHLILFGGPHRYHYHFGGDLPWLYDFGSYTAITCCLYSVFNQAVPIWIGTALLMNTRSKYVKFLIAAFVYPFGPFGFIGLIMLIGVMYFFEVARTKRLNIFEDARSMIQISEKIFIFLVSAGILAVFTSFLSTTGHKKDVYILCGFGAGILAQSLPSFLLLGSLIMIAFILILSRRAKSHLVAAAVCLLLLIPLVQVISTRDYLMRVSIPGILILAVYACGIFLDGFSTISKPLRIAFIAVYFSCAFTSFLEIYRSARLTALCFIGSQSCVADDIKTLADPQLTIKTEVNYHLFTSYQTSLYWNYCSVNYQNSFYWNYLCPIRLARADPPEKQAPQPP